NAERKTVVYGSAHSGLQTRVIVGTVIDVNVSLEGIGWTLGDVMHQTGSRIASEKRTLGTLENLDPIHVESGERLPLLHRDVRIVDVERHHRLHMIIEVVLGDATNRELRHLSPIASRNGDVRERFCEVDTGRNIHVLKFGTGER